jgi:hypothetical protein
MTWKHILAGLCGFTLGFWFCMPRDITLLPRYEVLVLDSSGKGLPAIYVKQLRQDFAISNQTTSSLATTDSYGRASFTLVRGRTSPLRRAILCGRRMAIQGIHAPCGYLHQITADVPNYVEASRSESDFPLKSRGLLLHIIMQKAP